MSSQERIVAVALHMGGVIFSLPSPARHHSIMHNISNNLGLNSLDCYQGFLTSTGRFVCQS
jgi:hypothetical protein